MVIEKTPVSLGDYYTGFQSINRLHENSLEEPEQTFFGHAKRTFISKPTSVFLPITLLMLSLLPKRIKALRLCPEILSETSLVGNIGTFMHIKGDNLYVSGDSCCPSPNPNFWIYDIRNSSIPPQLIGSFYNDRQPYSFAVDDKNERAFFHMGSFGLRILDIKKLCSTSSSSSSSSSSTFFSTTSSLSFISSSSTNFPTTSNASTINASTIIDMSTTSDMSSTSSNTLENLATTSTKVSDVILQTILNNENNPSPNIGIVFTVGIISGFVGGILASGVLLYFFQKRQNNKIDEIIRKEKSNFINMSPFSQDDPNITQESKEEYRKLSDLITDNAEYLKTPDDVHPV